MKEAKTEQCIIVDQEMTAGRGKKAYSTLETFTKTSQPKASVISDANGNFLTESAVVLKGGLNTAVTSTTIRFNQT
ncbi:hypothetical protein DPMN_128879 [Dreissena polymorpha]|uniref:Uncharacterized protein n=1 Tax=Dreissena polymorpha TaxID=45954 RepID=A0A9D4H7Z8_DREPO|nr:hypothetical protein DPMN_128879 [Dreissena polymorpha]